MESLTKYLPLGKKPLTITGVTAASKPYDGTTNADISSVTFDGVNLNRGTDYTVTANFDDAGVDNDKHITATVTLRGQTAKNYFLEQSSFHTTGNITKAAAPGSGLHPAVTVINDLAKTYEMVLSNDYLPTLSSPCEYGKVSYSLGSTHLLDGYKDTVQVKVMEENGQYKLKLTVPAVDYNKVSSVGTLRLYVSSDNYQDFPLDIGVKAKNKDVPVPDGPISASDITYGQALNDSKIAGKMKAGGKAIDGTFTWTNGTFKPAANDSYEAEWTFTPDAPEYATVTGKATVEVAPKSIEGATITLEKREFKYNAAEQSPKITGVTLKGWSDTITYRIVSGDKATNANNSITLTIEGTGNYTGTATAEWKIIPAELTVSVQSVTKEYDGTPNATVTPTFNGLKGKDTLTAADYSVTAAFEDAKVGYFKPVTGKVKLNQTATAKNYLLNDENFKTDNGTIAKAAAPTVQPVELTIYNGVQKVYFVDLPSLPPLDEGKSYGTVEYRKTPTINLSEGYIAQSELAADPENLNTLRLLLRMKQTGSLTGEIGTVTIPVTTSNYQDINLTVKVSAVNQIKPEPDGTITASEITYGNELSMSTITGKMKDPDTGDAVKGTFTWMDGTVKPDAGSNNATWTFTPDASYGEKYTTNNGTATVTVNRKTVTVSGITAKDKAYDGNTNAVLNYSAVTLDGILENDTLTVTAKGVFEKADIGKQKVTISDLTLGGASAANYVLAESGNQSETTATITAREVTVTITSKGGTYGSVVAAAAKLTGAVDGDNVPVTLTYTGNNYSSATVPVNAGSYTVTASIADSNYVLTGKTTANFVIEPKSIKDAKVVLGKGLAANGAEQTQTVEKVLLDGKELPANSYTVADNTATAHGIYTLTVTGKGNYTDSIAWTYVIAPSKAEDAPGEDIAISSGKVKVVVLPEGAVPSVGLLTDKAELLAMLVNSGDITADELVQIANGASVDIVLTVKEANVSAEIKTAMAQAAKGCTIGQYLDISLLKYMTVNGSQQAAVALPTTKDALTISVAVPDALINTNSAVNRTYCIVRNHKGTIDVLDAAFDAAGKTLTFKTDRFSIYAIAYKDTAVPSSGSNPGSNNSSNDSETKKNEVAAPTPAPTPASTSKPSTITAMPQTGDTSNPTLYVVLLVASLLGLAVVFVCKRRNNK
jgi:LPXTG-motif cell wall-anchored protein